MHHAIVSPPPSASTATPTSSATTTATTPLPPPVSLSGTGRETTSSFTLPSGHLGFNLAGSDACAYDIFLVDPLNRPHNWNGDNDGNHILGAGVQEDLLGFLGGTYQLAVDSAPNGGHAGPLSVDVHLHTQPVGKAHLGDTCVAAGAWMGRDRQSARAGAIAPTTSRTSASRVWYVATPTIRAGGRVGVVGLVPSPGDARLAARIGENVLHTEGASTCRLASRVTIE